MVSIYVKRKNIKKQILLQMNHLKVAIQSRLHPVVINKMLKMATPQDRPQRFPSVQPVVLSKVDKIFAVPDTHSFDTAQMYTFPG